jgi:hypothetical protein
MLEEIKKVDAPEFLLTRIHQKIKDVEKNKFSLHLVWTFAASLILLLVLNVLIINDGKKVKRKEVNLAEKFHLTPTNSFYNE